MIKMALDEYDTLEITIGARLPVGLFEVSHREPPEGEMMAADLDEVTF